jgi:hypothetical protein
MAHAAARAAHDPQEESAPRSPEGQARRTVKINGRPDGPPPARHLSVVPPARAAAALGSRVVQVERRRPARRSRSRVGANPDRLAMWAVMMALFLVLVTLLSSQ